MTANKYCKYKDTCNFCYGCIGTMFIEECNKYKELNKKEGNK